VTTPAVRVPGGDLQSYVEKPRPVHGLGPEPSACTVTYDRRCRHHRHRQLDARLQELTGASIEDEINLRPPVEMMTIRAIYCAS
jgi:hypothetical protein